MGPLKMQEMVIRSKDFTLKQKSRVHFFFLLVLKREHEMAKFYEKKFLSDKTNKYDEKLTIL